MERSRRHVHGSQVERRTLISPQELATRWGCSTKHIGRLVDRKAIPAPIKLGSLIRWSVVTIENFEEGRGNPRRGER
jgi:predicted DNA-binding transcriptional regulator AlpA